MYDQMMKKIKTIKKTTPFLVSVTTLDEKTQEWNTYVYTNKFPYSELDGTKDMLGKLVEEQKNKALNSL